VKLYEIILINIRLHKFMQKNQKTMSRATVVIDFFSFFLNSNTLPINLKKGQLHYQM